MPSVKLIAEKLFQENGVAGWTAADEVEELRGKLHLKNKDKDVYHESSEIRKEIYDSATLQSRERNKKLRKEVKARENGNEYVIKTALKDDRDCRLSVSRLTADQAVVEMDQRMCEAETRLDLWRYKRNTREQQLYDLQWELQHMQDIEKMAPEDVRAEQEITRLENAMDKADIRMNTAKILGNHYREIIDKLKMDSLNLPPKLDMMEAALIHTQSEITEFKQLAAQAFVLRDQANKQVHVMQQETFHDRQERNAVLEALREEVERRKEDTEKDKAASRAPRHTLAGIDNADFKALMELQKKQNVQKKMLSLQEACNRIKTVTHVNNLTEVAQRILKQKQTQDNLKKSVKQLETHKRTQLQEYNSRLKQFKEMKYTGDQKMSRGQKLLDEMQEFKSVVDKEHENVRKTLKNNGETLINVREAVATLLEKLTDVKLPSPEHSYPRGDVFTQLDLAMKKLERLMKDVGATSDSASFLEKKNNPQFQKFLLDKIGPNNVRIKLFPSAANLHDFEMDQTNEGALSRSDIKKVGQRLMESKVPKKKKTSKKK